MKQFIKKACYSLLFVAAVFCFAGNAWHQHKMTTLELPQTVTLHFGRQGVEDFQAYTGGESDDYPKSLSFYSLRWKSPNLGTVRLNHFGSTTTIPYVFHVMGVQDSKYTHGVGAMDINAGLSQAEFTTAEQAYQDYVALISVFRQAGWQQYFEPQNARIAKEDNFRG